jgi:hypothetical protein
MNNLFIAFSTLPFLAVTALAAQPTPLTDSQMDQVTAGQGDSAASIVVSHAFSAALGDRVADVNTMTSEEANSHLHTGIDQSSARAVAASEHFQATAMSHTDSFVAIIFPAPTL